MWRVRWCGGYLVTDEQTYVDCGGVDGELLLPVLYVFKAGVVETGGLGLVAVLRSQGVAYLVLLVIS